MPELRPISVIGFVPIIRNAPGFVTPVFASEGTYYVQDTTENGKPERLRIELDQRVELLREPVVLSVHTALIYGFFASENLQLFGDKEHVASCLIELRDQFPSRPMLQASIDAFVANKTPPEAEPSTQTRVIPWTDERIERLKTLWENGYSASQIANELGGLNRNAVIGKIHRLGLAGRATPSRPAKKIVQSRQAIGVSVRQLNSTMCKFPIGDPNSSDFAFCGAHAVQGSYCKPHAKLAYTPTAWKQFPQLDIPIGLGMRRLH
jgi:GcrA cell cycle regulator